VLRPGEPFFVHEIASNVHYEPNSKMYGREFGFVSYDLNIPWPPTEFLEELAKHFESRGWQRLEHDLELHRPLNEWRDFAPHPRAAKTASKNRIFEQWWARIDLQALNVRVLYLKSQEGDSYSFRILMKYFPIRSSQSCSSVTTILLACHGHQRNLV
jgi:hypothetical protein